MQVSERTATAEHEVPPRAPVDIESALAATMASLLDRPTIDRETDFFEELGADSMVIAEFCARLRAHPEIPHVAIKAVYQHPSVAALAEHLHAACAGPASPPAARPAAPQDRPVSTLGYWLCGILQVATILGIAALASLVVTTSYNLITPASGPVETYLRAIAVGGVAFLVLAVVPIVAKWLVIGRWRPGHIRIWSLRYYRFWLGRLAVRGNPLVLFAGTPIYPWYLRALGAKVGPGAVILARRVPVCTDLITIGAGAVVREGAVFSGYRAHGRHVELGPVEIGDDAFVGNATVLDVRTRVGDRAQLAHSSGLTPGTEVPDGAVMQGTPASVEVDVDFTDVDPTDRPRRHRVLYGMVQIGVLFLLTSPVLLSLTSWFLEWRSASSPASSVVQIGEVTIAPLRVLWITAIVFGATITLRAVLAFGVARLFARPLDADRSHPLFGARYFAHRGVQRLSNQPYFGRLFGDSSYVVHYLKALGYDISFEDQTGANFGQTVRHDHPRLVTVGRGTMAADDIQLINTDYSATSFRLGRTHIPARSFLGNQVVIPTTSTVGENCLLASKVAVPISGDERRDRGFLGSPSFEIPRLVFRDRGFEERRQADDFPATLAAKNRHNLGSMALLMLVRFIGLFGAVALATGASDVFDQSGGLAVFIALLGLTLVSTLYLILVEQLSLGFKHQEPLHCSIYDRRNWHIERYWKLNWQPRILAGTPFRGLLWRLYGTRVGRRLYDDGAVIVDKTMVTLGDDCVLNAGAGIQPHSQEDGSYKSDRVHIGSRCTVGVGALVHYGVTMADDVAVEANAFVIKGTRAERGTTWAENPAREVDSGPGQTHDEFGPQRTGSDSDWSTDMRLESKASSDGTADATTTVSAGPSSPQPNDTEHYWRAQLMAGGFTPIPRWTSSTEEGPGTVSVSLAPDVVSDLEGLARRLNTSARTLLLAAHARVVAALTGEQDVVVGFVPDGECTALPCRLTLAPGGSWSDLAEAADELREDVSAHAGVDLDALRAELNLTGPPFETAVWSGGLTLPRHAAFAISLHRSIGGSRLRVLYDPATFDEDTTARMAGYHANALTQLCADPDASPRAQSVVASDERDFLIEGLAGPRRELPDERFHELFQARVLQHPDAIAARHLGEEWTYAELNRRANQVAHALLGVGVTSETVVAVVTERNLAWMASVIGVLKAGAVYLPIEPQFPPGRIEKTLARAECRVIVTEQGSTESLDDALSALPATTCLLVDRIFDETDADADPEITVAANQLAYIYFTSGSTGEPKGAMCEHAGMINHLYAKVDDLELREGEVVAQIAPQCFDISLWQLISPLLVGGTTVIVDQDTILRPDHFVDLIVHSGVGVMQVVPSYLEVLLTYLDQHPQGLGDLHCVSVTGEALTLELAHRWFAAQDGIKLVNAYGLTETSDDTNHEVMTEAPVGTVPLGPAVNNAYVYVLDDQLAPVPLGAPGEIAFSGVCVGRGYINDPERTAAAYLDDPVRPGQRLYRSGDFGRWRPDGKLEYLGRRDAQVKIRGFRIEIGEIENTLTELDGVRRAAVVITERDDGNKQLVAFTSGTRRSADEFRAHLARSLPDYMVPSSFHWREELPLTDNGKINRKLLRAAAEESEIAGSGFEEPTTPTEVLLAGHWARILGLPESQIGRRDHFFDRGGSSLSAVELVVALDNALSLKDITGAPVLQDLARVLDGDLSVGSGILQHLAEPPEGRRATLVCLPYAGGNAVNFQSLAAVLKDVGIAVHAAELPGHQLTEHDEDFLSMPAAADRIVEEIRDLDPGPVALWGHSAGSALAVEIARRLDDPAVDLQAVFVAAQLPGDATGRRRQLDDLAATSDRQVVASMRRLDGFGDLQGLDSDQTAAFAAAIRHDLVASHRAILGWFDESPRLDVPLVCVTARDDAITADAASRHVDWEQCTDHVEFDELPEGGHFFVRTQPDAVARLLRERLLGEVTSTPALAPAERPTGRTDVRLESREGAPTQAIVEGDTDPVVFAATHRDLVRGQVTREGSLLVRGLAFNTPEDFLAVAQILSNGLTDDTEAFAPRDEVLGGTFTSSAWPANQQMCLHHELSYRQRFPGLLMFGCLQPPSSGGAIPLADASQVLRALPSDLVERFERQGWILSRNYTDEIGLSVGEAFGTEDRAAIESYCAGQAIQFEWSADGALRTHQLRSAVIEHPVTGVPCWFNQVAFLNEWTMKPEVREFLIDMYGEDGLPFTTRFGDGEPIGRDVVETINAAYDECTIVEPLLHHDLLLVDNIATAHGREPYEGDRRVVVALADPTVVDVTLPGLELENRTRT